MTFTAPVGDGNYVVQQGDCLESIGFARRIPWRKIWNHPRNAVFKNSGRTPNILLPGDKLYIPDLETKTVPAATDRRHQYCLQGVPSKIQIRVVKWLPRTDSDSDANGRQEKLTPRANVPYVLMIDNEMFRGETDGDGCLVQAISPGAQSGKLIIEPGTGEAYEIPLALGGLDPLNSASGVCQRLANLGFADRGGYAPDSQEFQDALRAFQAANGIDETGLADSITTAKLKDLHRS